jgi:rfaE bifunctional protein nucleotidyltransferase chain/domain
MKTKILPLSELKKQIDETRSGKKIVFTNGCFDILHVGHVTYLQDAKNQGDILIVGLNSDSSVKGLKGPTRPVQNESDRALILASLHSVDYVCLFSEDTPIKLIEALLPDVLVKGGDWPIEKIVGHEVVQANGGEVKSLPFVEGRSTTGILEKILKL